MLALKHLLEVESKMICITNALYRDHLDRIDETQFLSKIYCQSTLCLVLNLQNM